MRGKKPSVSHLLHGRRSKKLRCNLKTKMKTPQQKKTATDAFGDVIHSKMPILPNSKMSSILNVETDMQRKTRLGHPQLMQEKLPNEQKVCCPDSINMYSLSSSVKDGEEGEGECESLPASKNSQSFIFNKYQKENHELVKTDEELKQPGSIKIQVKLQIHFSQAISDSASCPIFEQFQFGKPECYARFSFPKTGEAKTDEIFSARECVVPSNANHQREQTGSIEKKETETLGCCMSAFSTSKRKRNFKQYSDMKTLVKPKCGILKAKKPSISYILSIKGGASPNHRKQLGCNLTMDQGEKMADKMYSFMTVTPDADMHSKIEREKAMLGEKRLNSKQVGQAISLHEGNVTSDDTKETNLQGKEEEGSEQGTLLKVVLQHSNCFISCSGQREELDLHKSENEGSGKILFVTEQDVPQQMQPADAIQVEEPKKNHQTQNSTIRTANSKLPLVKSKESLRSQILIDTMKCGIPSTRSHTGKLYSHGKEEKPVFNKNQQATVLESLDVSTRDPPESKLQRKAFTCTALKSKMSSKCVIMKARKTPISLIFNIPGNGCLRNLPSKTLKSRIIDFLVYIKYSEELEDLTAERKERLAQELPAKTLESLDLSTLALPTSKSKYLKCTGKGSKMSSKCVTLKAKNAPISKTFSITKHGTPRNRRQFKCNFKVMMQKNIPVADIILNAISSAMLISLDMNVKNEIKVETDEPWKMRFSHELQQQEQSPGGERGWCANSSDKMGSASESMKKVQVQGGEAALWNAQPFSFNAYKMKEPHFIHSGLELMNSSRKKIPESLTTNQELQQQTLFRQYVLRYIFHSILSLLPFEKQPKRTKTQPGLKDIRSPKILSPMPGKSIGESLIDTAQSGIPFEKSPRKELAHSSPEKDRRLRKDLPARTQEFSYFSMPASYDFTGQRNTAQISKSRTGEAQMVLKTINMTRSGDLSHGEQQDHILENMANEISIGRSNMFINTFHSSTLVSPAIKGHKSVKSKKGPLRKKSSIKRCSERGEEEHNEGKRLCTYSCNKWGSSPTTLESRWQNAKHKEDNEMLSRAGPPFLNSMGPRQDQNMLIAQQEAQRQALVSENISESVCSPLMIPFQTEKLRKNLPPQKDILHRTGEKISCPKSGKSMFDYLLMDEKEYSMLSDGNPPRKLDVHSAVSLKGEEEKECSEAQQVIKYRVDQKIPPTRSGNSVLGVACDESSRRKAGGCMAKKCEELQRDLLPRSTTSVLSDSKRQKEVFKSTERKNVTGPISVTMRAKKPLCSQTFTLIEYGNLHYRKEQGCDSIKDKQQHQSLANACSSPTPLSTGHEIDVEMCRTLKAETDQHRVKLKNSISLKLEKSPCYRGAEKANSTDTQNRSSYTTKMNMWQNKEEVGVDTISPMLPKHQEQKTQGRKDGSGVPLTPSSTSLPSLPVLRLDEKMQTTSAAGEIVYREPVSGDILKNAQNNKLHMPQKEERNRGKTVAVRGMTHTADVSVKSKKSPPPCTLHRTELHVNIGGQGQKIREGQGTPPGSVLRNVHVSKPPTNLKLDKDTQVGEEELGIERPLLFSRTISALSDAEKIENTETIGGDVRKRKQHLSQKEKGREQNRAKIYKDWLEITGFSTSQLQLPESSGAGNIKYADFREGINSCNTIRNANQHIPYKDAMDRVKIEGKGRILPQILTLRIQTCPLTNLLSRKRLLLNIKEQVKDVQKHKRQPGMVLGKACASFPSPSHLKQDTRMNEKKDTPRTIQPHFLPLKMQHLSNWGRKGGIKSLKGYMLKEKVRFKADSEDKMCSIHMDLKAKKLPPCTYSYNKWRTSKNTLESRWQNRKDNEDNEMISRASPLLLNSMGCGNFPHMLIAQQEAQRQALVSENISESVCSPLMIPFRTEKLWKNLPPQKYILHRIGEKILCPNSGKSMFDYLLIDEKEYSMLSDGNPPRKLDVHSAVSLKGEEEKECSEAQKVIKYRVDQKIPPTRSGNSVLGVACDESSRRKAGGRMAKKCEELQRDLLPRSTTSVLSDSKRQKEVFKSTERKNVTGPISVTMRAKKPLCSQTFTLTEYGNLHYRKEQGCDSIKDKQQHQSLANACSSPTPLSTGHEIDVEMCRTLKAETDQHRVKSQNSVSLNLEKSPCHWGAEKANSTDTQNRSSYTTKMNMQQNKEEVEVNKISPMLPKHQEQTTQGRKDGPGVPLTPSSTSLPSLPVLRLDKQTQTTLTAGEIVHTEPISGDTVKNVQNKLHMPQKEERNRGKTVAVRGMTHTADVSVKSKKSPPPCTLHRTELHVNIGGQGQKIREGQGTPPGSVLRNVHVSKPPTNLKLDKDTQVGEEELGIERPLLFSRTVSALSDAEKIENTETIGGDVRKRKQHLSQKEKGRDQNRIKIYKDWLEITGFSTSQLQLPESSGAGNIKYADFREGISSCNTIIKANQHMSYTDTKDRVKTEDGKAGIHSKIMTFRLETFPLTHPLSRKRLPLNIKEQVKDVQKNKGQLGMVLRKACASFPSPSHLKRDTRMNEKKDTPRTTQPHFPPLKIQDSSNSSKKTNTKSFEGYMLNKKDRPKIDIEDKTHPRSTDLKVKELPVPHILNTKELQCKIKEQKRKLQEDSNKLVMNIKNICASLVTLPYLNFDTAEGEGYMITIAKEPLPQLQSKESSDAGKIVHAETTDGELSTDVKELKEHTLQEEEKNGERNMDMNSIVDPNDMYLNTKKSPILLIYNQSDLQRKSKEQEGKVQKVTCEPAGVMLTKTCTSSSPPLQLNMNIRIMERSMPALTRPFVSTVNFQESSDSQQVVYVQPIIPDILITSQEGRRRMPQDKQGVAVKTKNLTSPKHQEKKMQGSKDKREVKMQESKEVDFNKPKKIALQNEDASGEVIRSLSSSVMNPSQAEETVESETNLERKKRICLCKFQEKSPNASEILKKDKSSVVQREGQNVTNVVPEDSQPLMVDQQQMQKLPSVRSEENLSSEVNKINLTPQTEERVVPGHDISRMVKEPDLLIIEQEEKAPEPVLTPTECPYMCEDPKENVETQMKSMLSTTISHPGAGESQQETQPIDTREGTSPPEPRGQSEPIQDTATQEVPQQNTFSGTVPILPQVQSNEIEIVANRTSEESLLPLYDAIKNVLESQIKTMIQDKVCADKLGEKTHPDDWKPPPFAGSPDITPTTIHPKFQPKPILESKALEIKLNLIPKTAKQSSQKLDLYSKQTISEDNSQRLYPRHKKMSFLSLEGIDTIKLNLKHKHQKDSPHISCMKTLTVNVSSGSKEIITELKSIRKLESGASSVTSANKRPLSQILQNYSVEQKDKLLIHFSMKTLETQMKAFPRIVRESYSMANTQERKKPLAKCIHSGVKVPKQNKIISLGFEEKSLHQIELDLQSKYLGFLLGLPVKSMIPKPNTLPKHILKLKTVSVCKKVDNCGESSNLSIDTELLEQHISFKKQSPHENSSLIRRFLEPTHMCAVDSQHGTAQKDTRVLSVLEPHETPEKDKHHVWFRETDAYESFDLKTQENAASLADYHSIQISQDFTGSPIDIENSADLERCSAIEVRESRESMFLEANPYLNQESENILFEFRKGIPLENLYKMKQIKTDSKQFYSDNSGSHHVRDCRNPSSVVTLPSYESHSSGKYRSSPKVQSPDWLCHSSLSTVEVPFKFSEEKLSWITRNRRYSLAPLTESNIKLHLAKSQDKPHRHPERNKADSDLFRNNVHLDCYHSYTQSKAKRTREKKVHDYESERDYFPSKRKSASKPHQENISFHYERKQNQPFFYACVPADSLEIIPQTIRWTIPKKTLRKRNFRAPLVAKISSSFHMWSLPKKLGGHS